MRCRVAVDLSWRQFWIGLQPPHAVATCRSVLSTDAVMAEPSTAGSSNPTTAPGVQQLHRTLVSRRLGGQEDAAASILVPVDDSDMVHVWAGVYIPPDEDAELVEVEDTKLMVTHRFAKKLLDAKIPFHLHVIVGPTDSDSVAELIRRKAQDIAAKVGASRRWPVDTLLGWEGAMEERVLGCGECIVMARHSKGRLKEMWVGSVTKAIVAKPAPHIPVVVVPHA
eukprot:scaffold4.g4596.t1